MTIVMGCLVATSAQAQSSLQLAPTSFDFGWVPQNATLVCQSLASGSGQDTIRISGVKTGCGCLAVRPEPSSIAVGDSLALSYHWQTKGFVGPKTVSAYHYAESDQRPVELIIRGNVVTDDDSTASILWTPRRLEFSRADLNQEDDLEKVITLTNRTQTALSVSLIAQGPEMVLGLPESIKANQTAAVQVAIVGAHSDVDFESSFTLEFSGNADDLLRVSIPVVGGDFSFRPDFTTTKQ